MSDQQFGKPFVASASGSILTTGGNILGFICASSSSGTLALYDNASAGSGNNILTTMNLVAGTYYPFPAKFGAGLYATFGGTASVTFLLG
jgi:hypothetical protein